MIIRTSFYVISKTSYDLVKIGDCQSIQLG